MKNEAKNLITISKRYQYSPSDDIFYYNNAVQVFTKKQHKLLTILVKNIGRYVGEDVIQSYVCNQDDYADSTIRSLVKRTREALKEDIIVTTRGFGYTIKNLDFNSDKLPVLEDLLSELDKKECDYSLILIKIDNILNIENFLGSKYSEAFCNEFAGWLKNVYCYSVIVTIYKIEYDELALLVKNSSELASSIAKDIIETGNVFYPATDKIFMNSTFSVGLYTGKHNVFTSAVSMLETALSNHFKFFEGSSKFLAQNSKQENIDRVATFTKSIYDDTIQAVFEPVINNATSKIQIYKCLPSIKGSQTHIELQDVALVMKCSSILTKIIIRKSFEYFQNKPIHLGFLISLNPDALDGNSIFKYIDYWQEKTRINPNRVIFKISEAIDLRQRNMLTSALDSLKQRGYKSAIDNFGVGYENFAYIFEEGVDFITINCSFMKGIEEERRFKIVSQLDKLIKLFGAKSIAKFVHEESMQNIIQEIGIDYSCGNFIGKPITDILKRDCK